MFSDFFLEFCDVFDFLSISLECLLLEEVILNPELDAVHQGREEHHNEEEFEEGDWVQPHEEEDAHQPERLFEDCLQCEEEDLHHADYREPYRELHEPSEVVDLNRAEGLNWYVHLVVELVDDSPSRVHTRLAVVVPRTQLLTS